MKYIYIIIILLLASATQAQDTITLYQEDVEMGGYGAQRYAFPFEAGDKMVFSFINVSHRPLKAIEIREENAHELILKFKRPYNVINKTIDIAEKADYSFHFKNKGLFGRKVNFTLKRIPKLVVPPDTVRHIVYKDSIVFDTIRAMKTVAKIHYDTIPEEILHTDITVGPTKDLTNKNSQCMELPLPEGNYYWAYWVGIDESDHIRYEELTAKPPPKWAAKEIEDPLTAYGMGLQNKLPNQSDLGDFTFFFLDGGQKTAFTNGQNIQAQKRPTYGVLQSWELVNLPIYACFYNKNSASPLKIKLKVVGFKIKERAEETEIEKLTIVESVIKVQVGERIHLIQPKN